MKGLLGPGRPKDTLGVATGLGTPHGASLDTLGPSELILMEIAALKPVLKGSFVTHVICFLPMTLSGSNSISLKKKKKDFIILILSDSVYI